MMNMILTLSSQGQLIIPKAVRDQLKVKPGDKVRMRVTTSLSHPQAVIEPANIDWVQATAGIGKGMYTPDPKTYIENERNSWDK